MYFLSQQKTNVRYRQKELVSADRIRRAGGFEPRILAFYNAFLLSVCTHTLTGFRIARNLFGFLYHTRMPTQKCVAFTGL